jgi:DNA-directed RNA polymerase delta subunit
MQKEANEYSRIYDELNKIKKGSKKYIKKKKELEEFILAEMQSKKIKEYKIGLNTFVIKTTKKVKGLTKDKIYDIIVDYMRDLSGDVSAEELSNYIWNHRESSTSDKLKFAKPKGNNDSSKTTEKENNHNSNKNDKEDNNDKEDENDENKDNKGGENSTDMEYVD